MRVLSIDVGIKNLAFCLFEKEGKEGNVKEGNIKEGNVKEYKNHFKIIKWDTIDISNSINEDVKKCEFIDDTILKKKNQNSKNSHKEKCNQPSKFKKGDKCFCLKHAKKQPFAIPKLEHNPTYIQKQKIQKLFEIANKYNIPFDKKIKKTNLVHLINEYIDTHYLQTIEVKKAAEVNLFNIGSNIQSKLDRLFQDVKDDLLDLENNLEKKYKIDYIIIENQIGPIATRMKTIQGMLVQYFVMSKIDLDVGLIEFISASNKLKEYDSNLKTTYNDRKKLGIEKCLEIITKDLLFQENTAYFNTHKKKDDLSDSFLQGLWFIKERKL